MEKFQVNSQERAVKILNTKKVISEPGTYKCKHRVSKTTFEWEDGSGDYKIVNTNLINSYQKKDILSLLEQGQFQEATNKGLTFRASLELAKELESAIESTVLVEETPLSTGEVALLIRKMRPIAAVEAQAFSFSNAFMSESPKIEVIQEEVVGA